MYKNYAKRKLDCCIAFIVLIIGLAPMLIIAFAIKIDSHGPVLFKQDRIGKDGKVFKMLKFRSMYIGAEKKEQGYILEQGIEELREWEDSCVQQVLMNCHNV